jgi:flagellin
VLDFQIGMHNNAEQDRFSFDTSVTDVTPNKLGVAGITVMTKEQSQNNLDVIDSALEMVSGNRATLGAMQNRLQSAVNNMGIYNENLSNARSRIADVDMASETAELTKQNILSQAGTAVLSQANQNGNLALKLI